jgi:hypothetical protein
MLKDAKIITFPNATAAVGSMLPKNLAGCTSKFPAMLSPVENALLVLPVNTRDPGVPRPIATSEQCDHSDLAPQRFMEFFRD